MSLAFWWQDWELKYLYDLRLRGGWWGGSRSLDTDRNRVGKTDSPRTVGSPRAGWHVSGDVSHRCEVSGVRWPCSWRSTDVIACCWCSSDARHNTDPALLPLPASTRALTGEMKPDAQFPETRGQREINLRGLDRQELAPIVAETIRRAVIKRWGRDRRGLTLVMAETIRRAVIKRRGRDRRGLTLIMAKRKRWARKSTVRLHRTS